MRPGFSHVPGVFVALALAMAVPTAQQPARQVVRFAHAWDGTRLVRDAVITVSQGRIESITSAGEIPSGAAVTDLRPLTAIPGLVDAHTHITYYWDRAAGTSPRGQRRHPAVTVFLAQQNARRTIETGVTTVRDLNASGEIDMAMRDLVARGAMKPAPRMFVSGQGLSGRPAPPGAEAMARMVNERLDAGADWIKVFASTGGFNDVSGTRTLSFEEMKAAVDATHARGRRIAIHSYGPDAARDAVRAGADSLEHGADLDDDTLREMARRGTVYVPTIDHNRYYIDSKNDYGFPEDAEGPLRNYIERNLESARRAHAAGVKFAMGSDAVYSMFGQNTRELTWFVKAGMTPAQALTAATVNGAELLGVADRLGRLAPGYLADIVAVEGDPLESIDAAVWGVRWVMKAGEVLHDAREWSRRAPDRFTVRLDTSRGPIAIECRRDQAPRGADRFYNLVRLGFFTDVRFHRVVAGRWAQFGIHGDPATSDLWRARTIPDDPPRSSNVRGAVAFAFAVPHGRTTQVFINLGDNAATLDAQGFAPFGRVVRGMDAADALFSEYGEASGGGIRAGKQEPLFAGGNAFLAREFPKLDYIRRAVVEH